MSCKFCGKSLDIVDEDGFRTKRIDSTFCSKDCRYKFHNAKKRLHRAIAIVAEYLESDNLSDIARIEVCNLLKLDD